MLNRAKPTTAWHGVRTIQHSNIFKFLHLYVPQTGTVLSPSRMVKAVNFLICVCVLPENECSEFCYAFPKDPERMPGNCLETDHNLYISHPIHVSMHYYAYNLMLYNLDLLTEVISMENGQRFRFTGGSHIGRAWDHG